MLEMRATNAWQQAREIAETIAKGVNEINQKSEEKASPLSMTREQFVNELTVEMAKLYYHKFNVLD